MHPVCGDVRLWGYCELGSTATTDAAMRSPCQWGGATFQADRTDLMKGEWQDGVRITFVKTPANKRLTLAGAKTVCAKGRDVCVCVCVCVLKDELLLLEK